MKDDGLHFGRILFSTVRTNRMPAKVNLLILNWLRLDPKYEAQKRA